MLRRSWRLISSFVEFCEATTSSSFVAMCSAATWWTTRTSQVKSPSFEVLALMCQKSRCCSSLCSLQSWGRPGVVELSSGNMFDGLWWFVQSFMPWDWQAKIKFGEWACESTWEHNSASWEYCALWLERCFLSSGDGWGRAIGISILHTWVGQAGVTRPAISKGSLGGVGQLGSRCGCSMLWNRSTLYVSFRFFLYMYVPIWHQYHQNKKLHRCFESKAIQLVESIQGKSFDLNLMCIVLSEEHYITRSWGKFQWQLTIHKFRTSYEFTYIKYSQISLPSKGFISRLASFKPGALFSGVSLHSLCVWPGGREETDTTFGGLATAWDCDNRGAGEVQGATVGGIEWPSCQWAVSEFWSFWTPWNTSLFPGLTPCHFCEVSTPHRRLSVLWTGLAAQPL